MAEETAKMTLEEMFCQLDQCIRELESEDISLEQSFLTYEKGMNILKECNETIDRVEKKVMMIREDGSMEEM